MAINNPQITSTLRPVGADDVIVEPIVPTPPIIEDTWLTATGVGDWKTVLLNNWLIA